MLSQVKAMVVAKKILQPVTTRIFPTRNEHKAYLEIVGKFCSSSIAWVHCDEDSTRCLQNQLHSLKDESVHLPQELFNQ